jgi:YidC/Oxa1 family membrane protein insertase
VPGADLLRERGAVRAFERQEPAFRELVFYSEGAADWPHMGPIVQRLLSDHDQKVSYLTSDPDDPVTRLQDPRLRVFQIGSGTMRTVLFARIQCRRFVMTLPDLGKLWLKRSVHPVEYVYVFHSMNSTHTSYRLGAFDEFDTIFCVGPHHVAEIRKTEEVYGLKPKRLVEHGSVKLDSVIAEVQGHPPVPRGDGPLEVLVAPTWGESSLIERPIGREVISTLLGAGFRTVLRLHPMTTRRMPELVRDLQRTYGDDRRFSLESDMSAVESWVRSDLMVSDWSGAATEYAFATGKPVIYIDTPQKMSNPEATRIGLDAFERRIRSEVGCIIAEAAVDDLPSVVQSAANATSDRPARAAELTRTSIFNIGRSAAAAATSISS